MAIPIRKLKQWLAPIAGTPLHPQWLLRGRIDRLSHLLQRIEKGTLLDIGCGNGHLRKTLRPSIHYVGLDYPTTMALGYEGTPDILADASSLPISDAAVDTVVMLDVLEHLAEPDRAVAEAARVLRTGGQCILSVPFLYPLHDEPHDYRRWTRHGLDQLLEKHGFRIREITETTSPVETAALLMNIALAWGLLDAVQKKSAAILAAPLLLPLIFVVNVMGRLLGRLLPCSTLMPVGYLVVAALDAEKPFTTSRIKCSIRTSKSFTDAP